MDMSFGVTLPDGRYMIVQVPPGVSKEDYLAACSNEYEQVVCDLRVVTDDKWELKHIASGDRLKAKASDVWTEFQTSFLASVETMKDALEDNAQYRIRAELELYSRVHSEKHVDPVAPGAQRPSEESPEKRRLEARRMLGWYDP